MDYLIHILVMIGIYLILSYSLNLLIGFSGLLSLCHAAFYGIGAYIYTLISTKLGFSFLTSTLIAFIGTGIIAFLVSLPSLKFRGDFFVIVTLGFQMIFFVIADNWISLTSGPYGITGIPRPVIFGWKINKTWEFLIIVLIFDLIFCSFLFLLYNSPFGLILKSLREDEKAAEALGKSSFSYFLKAFVLSGSIASISGALFASYMTYIDPTSFTLDESIFLVTILLLGGSGNKIGPFLGVLIMILVPEALRFLGLPDSIAANLRQIIYGIALIVLMYFRPKGMAGEFEVK